MNRATVGLSERLEHHSVTQVYTPISKIKLIRCETCTEIGEKGALEFFFFKYNTRKTRYVTRDLRY